MALVSKTLAPNGQLIDPASGRATPPFNNYLNSLTILANSAVSGTVTTAPGSGLSGGGLVADGISLIIAPNGVSNTMIRESAAYSVIGRPFGTDGDVQDISATANNRVLARIGDVLAFTDISALPATVADGSYGDITVSGTGTVWTINNNVVSNAKFRQSAALSVVGRSGSTTGNVDDIVGTASQFLGVNAAGNALGFQTMAGDATLSGPTLTIGANKITFAKFVAATQKSLVGASAAGNFGEITLGSGLGIAGGVISVTSPLVLFDHFANSGNVTTGETDLYSDTIAAGQLGANGAKLKAYYGGLYVSSGTATRQIRVYFAGTLIFDTGALTLSLSSAWIVNVDIIRVSASIIRYLVSLTTEGAALAAYTAAGPLTGLTLANTAILKITGQAGGVGAATDDIVATMGSVSYINPA